MINFDWLNDEGKGSYFICDLCGTDCGEPQVYEETPEEEE